MIYYQNSVLSIEMQNIGKPKNSFYEIGFQYWLGASKYVIKYPLTLCYFMTYLLEQLKLCLISKINHCLKGLIWQTT